MEERNAQFGDLFSSLMDDAKVEAAKEGEELNYNVLMLHEMFNLLEADLKFDNWELQVACLLFTDIDQMNQLVIDSTFLQENNRTFDETDPDDVEDKKEYIDDCKERIKERMIILKTVVAFEEMEKEKGRPALKITDAPVFAKVRF